MIDFRLLTAINSISSICLLDCKTAFSKFFRKSELLFQNDATEQNVLNDLKDKYEFIAFATHSVKGMNKFYNDRGLVLTPINSNSHDDDGFLSSQEIKSLDLQNNPTILLTACNTIDSQYYLSLPYCFSIHSKKS